MFVGDTALKDELLFEGLGVFPTLYCGVSLQKDPRSHTPIEDEHAAVRRRAVAHL